MKKCEVCDITIPEGRLKVIPFTTTCVSCSTEEKWSGGHVIHHKTGNEVCVIKDINVAKEFHKMSMRAGFGTMRGMKPGVSGGTKSKGLTVGVTFQADTATFEEMGTKAMDMYELFGIDKLNVKRSNIPSVTHVDYSARIQTVHKETNPIFHKLIEEFEKITKYPVLVNTSFNVRGEPIVCSVTDAFNCFMGTDLDVLVCNNFILYKQDQSDDLLKDYKNKYELD